MKKLLNNKKGFTLIELLAVIVILAILVMVAIPAVTKYLNSARQGTFVDNAQAAISAVRNDVITKGTGSAIYTIDEINDLLEKKLETSPFGSNYNKTDSYVRVVQTEKTGSSGEYEYKYYMCLVDSEGHGFEETEENDLDAKDVKMSGITCTKSSS